MKHRLVHLVMPYHFRSLSLWISAVLVLLLSLHIESSVTFLSFVQTAVSSMEAETMSTDSLYTVLHSFPYIMNNDSLMSLLVL